MYLIWLIVLTAIVYTILYWSQDNKLANALVALFKDNYDLHNVGLNDVLDFFAEHCQEITRREFWYVLAKIQLYDDAYYAEARTSWRDARTKLIFTPETVEAAKFALKYPAECEKNFMDYLIKSN